MGRLNPGAGEANRTATARTVVVTGVHAEELDFGDRVTRGLESGGVDVLRIPHGLPQRCGDIDQKFRHDARLRELYLQLHQQVRGRYRLLIGLHSGVDEDGPGADVYCHDAALLDRLGSGLRRTDRVRLIRIVAPGEPAPPPRRGKGADAVARTCIPAPVWTGDRPLYVGLEIYLPPDGDARDAERLARRLIACIPSRAARDG